MNLELIWTSDNLSAYLTLPKVYNGGALLGSCCKALDGLRNGQFHLPLKEESKDSALGGGEERRMESLFKEKLDPSHHYPHPYIQITSSITPGHMRFTFWRSHKYESCCHDMASVTEIL